MTTRLPPEHGTYGRYIMEAKAKRRDGTSICDPCAEASRQYQRDRKRSQAYGRKLKVPALGSCRRLEALMALGWSGDYLAIRLHLRRSNLPRGKYTTIRKPIADRVLALYLELKDHPGPSKLTLGWARKHGWFPPECWEDVDMDDPAAEPKPARTDEEKIELGLRLIRLGLDRTAVAHRLRMNIALADRLAHESLEESCKD